jgi:hypothetical protein
MAETKDADAEPARVPAGPPLPRVFRRWMLGALLFGLAVGGAGFWIWWQYHETWERSPPRINPCFQALGRRLQRPLIASPSEPYTIDNGETVYLSDAQNRAAGCAARLTGRLDYDLVRIWSTEDPEAQVSALREIVVRVPSDPSRDQEAFGMWRLAQGSLAALPASSSRDKARADIDQFIACRFNHPQLPGCPTRPGFPILAGILGGIGGSSLLALLGALIVRTIQHFRARLARRRAGAAALDPVVSGQ